VDALLALTVGVAERAARENRFISGLTSSTRDRLLWTQRDVDHSNRPHERHEGQPTERG
jgi:hypothetical protein